MANSYKNKYLQGVDQYLSKPDSAAKQMLESAGVPTSNPQNPAQPGSTSASKLWFQRVEAKRKLKEAPKKEDTEKEPENDSEPDGDDKGESVTAALGRCETMLNSLISRGKITNYDQVICLLRTIKPDVTLSDAKKVCPQIQLQNDLVASHARTEAALNQAIASRKTDIEKKIEKGEIRSFEQATAAMSDIPNINYSSVKKAFAGAFECQPDIDPKLIDAILENMGNG